MGLHKWARLVILVMAGGILVMAVVAALLKSGQMKMTLR